jgi:hypothetical protein
LKVLVAIVLFETALVLAGVMIWNIGVPLYLLAYLFGGHH